MPDTTNEMALPVINVPPVASAPVAEPDMAPAVDTSVVVGSPATSCDPANISVWAESIQQSGTFDVSAAVATFDVIFNVGVREGDTTKTYRIVKRIGIDKERIACDAQCSTPVTIVEAKAEQTKAQAAETARRFRILAGLE